MQLDINFIKTCKREDLIRTFAKTNVAIKHGKKVKNEDCTWYYGDRNIK